MTTKDIKLKEMYIKKRVKDLELNDIILHPIYRLDGLMLINQYKILTSDLASKVKNQVSNELPVIVLSNDWDLETFNGDEAYNDVNLIETLINLTKTYNQSMQVQLEKDAFVDMRVDLEEYFRKQISSNVSSGNLPLSTIDTKGIDYEIDYKKHDFISYLFKSPFFSSIEDKVESFHLKERGINLKKALIKKIVEDPILYSELNKIKDYKDILLLHSINTTTSSLMMGLTLELSEDRLLDLVLANLLIDISITRIPKVVFNQRLKNNSSEASFYDIHLREIKKLTEKLPLIRKESILYGILDHHEYYNGQGFQGKKATDISMFGRIINIAQAYDEMVGGYFLNDGIRPIHALQKIWEDRGKRFDPDILRVYIDRTNFIKQGQLITFSSQQYGRIIGFEDYINYPLHPVLKLNDGRIIDLLNLKKKSL